MSVFNPFILSNKSALAAFFKQVAATSPGSVVPCANMVGQLDTTADTILSYSNTYGGSLDPELLQCFITLKESAEAVKTAKPPLPQPTSPMRATRSESTIGKSSPDSRRKSLHTANKFFAKALSEIHKPSQKPPLNIPMSVLTIPVNPATPTRYDPAVSPRLSPRHTEFGYESDGSVERRNAARPRSRSHFTRPSIYPT